jgi:hypothetical protein
VTAVAGDSVQTSEVGQLTFLDNSVDSLTGTVTGKANFENSSRRMWPGELVYLTVELSVQRGVVAVPSDAVQTGQQGAYVYVVDAKNTAQTRPVMPGAQVNDLTVITRGLNAGERVVTDGQSRLNPGARVAMITNSDSGGVGGGARGPAADDVSANGYGGGTAASAGGITDATTGSASTAGGGAQTGSRGGASIAGTTNPGGGTAGSVAANAGQTTRAVQPAPAPAVNPSAASTSNAPPTTATTNTPTTTTTTPATRTTPVTPTTTPAARTTPVTPPATGTAGTRPPPSGTRP